MAARRVSTPPEPRPPRQRKPEPLDPEDVAALLAVDKETGQTEFERRKCSHCGGVHARACPRVKRMAFAPEGSRLIEVEFWPHGQWDESNIIWPEMLGVIDKTSGGDGGG